MKKWIFIVFALIITSSAAVYSSVDENVNSSAEDFLTLRADDIYLGSPDAPVVMIDYDSLSCVHCARFNSSIFPYIKEKYIDKGIVVFIMREFPIDPAAFYASMLSHCYAKNDVSKLKKIRNAFFNHQQSWLKNDYKPALRNIAKFADMSDAEMDRCTNNIKLKNKIAKSRLDAIVHLNIEVTPMFFVNGARFPGLSSIEYFDSVINEALQAQPHSIAE